MPIGRFYLYILLIAYPLRYTSTLSTYLVLGYRDAAAVTSLAPAWLQQSVGKAPIKRGRPILENSRI